MPRRAQERTQDVMNVEPAMPIPQADPTRWVLGMLAAYLLLLAVGAVALQPMGRMRATQPANWNEAIFTAVDAGTLTGFERTLPPERFASDAARFIVMGLTLAGTLVSLIAGGLLVTRIAGLPVSDGEVVAGSVVLTVLATLLGAVAVGNGSIPDVLMLALSAFANSGVHLANLPAVDSLRTLLVLMPLSVLGGIGVPVLLEIRSRIRGRQSRLSEFSWLVLTSTAVLYIVALLIFVGFMSERTQGEASSLGTSSVAAVNVRGAGFGVDPVQQWPRPVQWEAMGLMAIGWNPGGTGGGLKITALIAVWSLVVALVRGRQPSQAGGFAVAWIGTYAIVVFAAVILQIYVDDSLSGDRALFEAISAASNVGLSMYRVQGGDRDLILSAVMLFGRVAPIALLLWMWRRRVRGLPVA